MDCWDALNEIVDRLDDRVCCGAVVVVDSTIAEGVVLERGVRGGNNDSRDKTRDALSMFVAEGELGALKRKFRLIVRNEGVIECLDLCVRAGMGVESPWE